MQPSSELNQCLLCKQSSAVRYLEQHVDSGITYTLYECPFCTGQFWTPFKNPGSAWYEHDTRYADANNDPTLEPNWNHKKVISFLAPRAGRVFDIGCGTGNFLAHARAKGWEVAGNDFDRNAVHASQTVFRLPNIEVATLEESHAKHIKARHAPYDLITFFDVFEHIDNHTEFLAHISDMLTPGGHISMSMPYRYGSRWLQPNDLPPRHLTRWDRTALTRYLDDHGFTVRYIKRVPASFFYIVMKLRFKYGKFASFGLMKKVQEKSVEKQKLLTQESMQSHALVKRSFTMKVLHTAAKIKDIVLFGIPAFFIWLYFLHTRRRYNGLFAIAQKKTS